MTGAPPPLPLTLVTGPTGAGKTRLINTILALPAFANAIAIANDTGTTALACPPPEAVADIGPACLCCAGGGAFTALLERLVRARDNDRIAPFGRLIFETSGVADPAALAGELMAHPYLSRRFALTGILLVEPRPSAPNAVLAAQRAAAAATLHAKVADPAPYFDLPFDAARLPEMARRSLFRLSPRR